MSKSTIMKSTLNMRYICRHNLKSLRVSAQEHNIYHFLFKNIKLKHYDCVACNFSPFFYIYFIYVVFSIFASLFSSSFFYRTIIFLFEKLKFCLIVLCHQLHPISQLKKTGSMLPKDVTLIQFVSFMVMSTLRYYIPQNKEKI